MLNLCAIERVNKEKRRDRIITCKMDVRNITPSMKQQLMKMAGITDAKVIKTN